MQATAFLLGAEMLLLIAWLGTANVRHYPDLQKVHGPRIRVVVLAMRHAAAGAHQLHIAGTDHRAGAQGVLVFQRAFEHIGENFHVAVRVLAEAFAGGHAVIVDHQQIGKTLFFRVAIAGEGKGMERLQPAVIGQATIRCFAKGQHDEISFWDVDSSE
ncbi:hypothetical protein D3C76_1275130 [compost metagenome]